MGLTNSVALKEVQRLFDMCFDINSFCDRMVYVLSLKYNMVKFSEWFHLNIAHKFPLLADEIQEFGDLRGDLFSRGAVPPHNEEFSTIDGMIEAFTMKISDLERQCVVALKKCAEQGSESFEDFLRDFNVRNIVPMLKQATVFYEQIKAYADNNDLHKWNKDFEAWVIPTFKGGA